MGVPDSATNDTTVDNHMNNGFITTASSITANAKETGSDPSRPVSIEGEIEGLARQFSATIGDELHAFKPRPGSQLDPNSPRFDAREWVQAIVRLNESDPNSAPSRSLGVAFQNLNVHGWGTGGAEYQKGVLDIPLAALSLLATLISPTRRKKKIDILHNFEGVIEEGELLLVLGPPGSGCSTLLKTIAGETAGLEVDSQSYMNFRGVNTKHVRDRFRGDVLYNAEVDTHIPHLTVGETLLFAARATSVRHVPEGITRYHADTMMRDVMMAIFGIGHTIDTQVGNDVVRGVSGGERKRVSIAEAALTGAKLQCWDNTTRGLDSGNAINFCKTLRIQADLLGVAGAVAIYQAPQSAYELFDRVTVLYEGRQIFFGKIGEAKRYFEELGFECPDRQTTPDFLTSMTSPEERRVKPGWENKVPRTPDDFAQRWQYSDQRKTLQRELADYEFKHPREEREGNYKESRQAEKSNRQRKASPYTISYPHQVSLTIWRGWRRLLADPGFTIASLLFNLIISLVIGSMFFNLSPESSSFYARGGTIFFSLLFNAFASQLEVLTVYAERPIVEKQNRYAFYHQSAQAIASYLIDIPYKTANMFTFNLVVYFMTHLRRDAGHFFFFCLTTYLTTLVMSCVYRTLASITRTSHQAMVPASILTIGLMVFTGFTIPTDYMLGWSRWMNYINPLAYAFESLMANEFHNREFACTQMIPEGPGYENLPADSQICSSVGARAGSMVVDGDRYLNLSFKYYNAHKWRNVGILCGFLVAFFVLYMVSAEYAKPPRSRGEVLVFKKGRGPSKCSSDVESQQGRPVTAETTSSPPREGQKGLSKGVSVFHWEDLCYDIQIKGKDRRLLDQVDGWVKPGVSTALMGVSGAGKTTLLDVLATRVTMGVVSGDTRIDGRHTDASFQHRVGYVQQQDLHLNTMTVREALEFSALLRQSAEISKQDKLKYVDEVIDMLDMQEYSDAVIGVPGEGLNVEQRKRLTIGVELAARPQLLVFLDEPTSGLDSQTSWAICDLIEKLTTSGQAVLCTIHQPSAILFQRFDRLLLLAPGGKTVYFGDLGHGSKTLLEYFERNGASPCPPDANPAEYMLQMIEPPKDESESSTDWAQVWRNSPEYQGVKQELARLNALPSKEHESDSQANLGDASQHQEFVASFWTQFWQVLFRTWKHFWRSPTYIWSKISLIVISSLYVGFSFSANNTLQGLQNQLYAIFMYLVIFGNINEQIMPMFVPQRSLYEVRERPSKIYRWTTFVLSNIIVEVAWNTLMAVLIYFCWYYPVGFVQNTTSDDQQIRGFLIFLFLLMFMLFTSTFSHFVITWIELPEVAGILATLMWMLCIAFCGVGVPPSDIPHFWKFMYRASPATYLMEGLMSVAVSGSAVNCASNEILYVNPPGNMTCGDFLGPFANATGGNLLNPSSQDSCAYCSMSTTDGFLSAFDIYYSHRWRDFGLLWVYVVFNTVGALALYWVFRVPKGAGVKRN